VGRPESIYARGGQPLAAADLGELLVQLPDRLGVAPRLQVEPQPAHVLQVGRDLLALCQRERVGADAAGLVDVALADVRRGQGRE